MHVVLSPSNAHLKFFLSLLAQPSFEHQNPFKVEEGADAGGDSFDAELYRHGAECRVEIGTGNSHLCIKRPVVVVAFGQNGLGLDDSELVFLADGIQHFLIECNLERIFPALFTYPDEFEQCCCQKPIDLFA